MGKTLIQQSFILIAGVACWSATGLVASAATAPSSLPTASWLFNDGSGTTATAFTGGAGENGTLQTGAAWANVAPFAADGGQSINVALSQGGVSAPGFTIGSAGTISTWVYLTTPLSHYNYLYDSTGTRTLSYLSGNAGDPNELAWVSNTSTIASDWATTATVTSGEWHNIVFTWDDSLAAAKEVMYLDGVAVATANVTVPGSTPTTWVFGTRFASNGPTDWNALQGNISEYAIWDTALSADNVAWLGADGGHSLTALVVPEPGTVSALLMGLSGLAGLRFFRRKSVV